MIKKILLLLISLLIIQTPIYANSEISSISKNWFNNFSDKISKKYNTQNEIIYFENFSDKLNKLKLNKKFNELQINLINEITQLSNEYIFEEKLKLDERNNKDILDNKNILDGFKNISYNSEHIFLENGIWYTYNFDSHLKFPKGTNIKTGDLNYNGIIKDKHLVFLKDDNLLGFVKEYKKIKLISDSIIFGYPEKYNLLKEIKDDKVTHNYETDEYFKILKDITYQITKGKTEKEKIKIIYNYILENIKYSENIDLSDYKIFSGIDTFKNQEGVCEGYVKMFQYMLSFANINNTEVIRGYVIDAQDFPEIGHAWLKIGDNYYDPTFDDPVGGKETREYIDYKYFGLPYDLFYTNRYDFGELPENIKTKSLSQRKEIITNNTIPILEKYRDSGYNILKPFILKLDNGIKLNKEIDVEDLKKIMGYYEVDNFKVIKDGKTKYISGKFGYYNLNNNIDSIIETLNYNFDGYYLFKWKLDNGSYEYRLAYDVVLK